MYTSTDNNDNEDGIIHRYGMNADIIYICDITYLGIFMNTI